LETWIQLAKPVPHGNPHGRELENFKADKMKLLFDINVKIFEAITQQVGNWESMHGAALRFPNVTVKQAVLQ